MEEQALTTSHPKTRRHFIDLLLGASVLGWLVSLAYPIIRFFIPFFLLLCRPAKRKLTMIGVLAAYSLIMVYLDMYWLVMPNFYKEGPELHWLDLATLGATVSVCGLVFWGRFKKHKLAPVGDLRFEQSLHFENV